MAFHGIFDNKEKKKSQTMEQTVKTTNTMPGQEIPNSANMCNTNSVVLFNDLPEESNRKMMLSMLFNQFLVSRKYV